MTLDPGKCLFYKHRSPWEVAANAGGALTARSGKHWPALAGTVLDGCAASNMAGFGQLLAATFL